MAQTARYIAVICALATATRCLSQEPLQLTSDPTRTVNRIDEKVYGHFLEHIYYSCNGGLWGELVWNRSFEQNSAGQWSIAGDRIFQQGRGENIRLTFGDPAWTDYEFSLEARKTGGAEGFLILFRVAGEDDFYWANLGGWGNVRHQLERGRSGEQRWHGIGPSQNGSINRDKWYRIDVRCEGRRFLVKLDGQTLIDFTDDQRAHLRGAVGIGTWVTQAEFRNLKVTSLDGATLFQGAPPMSAAGQVARHWALYGTGRATLETQRPFNSRFSQRIVGDTGEAGLEQAPICVRSGETYLGSLWARGRASENLVVRLRSGDEVLAESILGQPSDDWQRHDFQLTTKQSVASATLQVGGRGSVDLWLDQVSLMPKSWADEGGFRPDLLQAVADLRPPIIRWPGGCFASAYRWKDGIGPQDQRRVYPIEIWDDRDVNSYGTDEFLAMCRKVGAEPLIVVNIGTPQWRQDDDDDTYLPDVLDWIEYCNGPADSTWGKVRAANGHPEPYGVKYWEIDNETWHMGASAYADAVCQIAPLMRKADPSIKLAACGSAGYGKDRNGLRWNQVVIERCADLVDYISIHHYENPDQFADGPRRYEEFFRWTADLIKSSKNPDLKIYVSEWNAQSTDWRTGLYAGGLLNAFERCGDSLEIGGPALFLRHVSATAWDNAFINFDQCSWFPAPNYVVMKLWRDHYAADRIELGGDSGRLNAVATKSDDGQTVWLKIVNPEADAASVAWTIKDFPVGKAAMQLVAPDALRARNTLDAVETVRPMPGTVESDGSTVRFRLPRWSAAVIEARRK